MYEKVSCHPAMKKYVNPRVEYLWNLFPFNAGIDYKYHLVTSSWKMQHTYINVSKLVMGDNIFYFLITQPLKVASRLGNQKFGSFANAMLTPRNAT